MFSRLRLTDEEKKHRRQMTNFAVKLMLLAVGVALLVQLLYYFAVISRPPSVSSWEFPLQMSVTVSALGLLALLLGVNHMNAVPHWVASSLFLLALTFLALFSDNPHEVIHGRSTMFFMIPILLSGVLIHSYATFGFTTLVISLIAVYAMFTPGAALESPNIIFFYLFAGLVAIVLRSLEKSTFRLRHEAAESNTILSSLRGSYILTDKNNRILRLNERTTSIFPLAKLGANLVEIIRDTRMEISDEDLQHLIDVATGDETEDVQVRISGKYYYAANIYIPANKEHLIFLRDITADVEVDRLKDTALAMVSHELRTPLTAIRGHAEMALRQPYTAVSNATRIQLNTQRLLIMVENLLSQSRLRTGKIKSVPAPTNLDTVFHVVYSLLASEAKEKQLEFEMEVDKHIPVVMVDAVLLQQILTNLGSNAIKFTSKGKVTMTATLPDPDHWGLSVTDTGPGIPASKRSEIFKEFFQAEAQTVYDRPHQGTGLGLSIVQGLAEQTGGKLTLRSEEGVGSNFSILFPLVLPKEITRRRKQNG